MINPLHESLERDSSLMEGNLASPPPLTRVVELDGNVTEFFLAQRALGVVPQAPDEAFHTATYQIRDRVESILGKTVIP